jgi:hypothetical protein
MHARAPACWHHSTYSGLRGWRIAEHAHVGKQQRVAGERGERARGDDLELYMCLQQEQKHAAIRRDVFLGAVISRRIRKIDSHLADGMRVPLKMASCAATQWKISVRVAISFEPDMTCPFASHRFVLAISSDIARLRAWHHVASRAALHPRSNSESRSRDRRQRLGNCAVRFDTSSNRSVSAMRQYDRRLRRNSYSWR